MPTDLSGHILDHYHLIERIGGGGMGDVYRAIDRETGRTVAVKVLKEHLIDSDEFVHRFAQEGNVAMQLGRHPHLVTVYDVGRADGRWYLAMAFLEGRPLSRILREYPVLPTEYVVRYIGQIAAALDYMHGQKPAPVVHRDVKPGNIMIDDTGQLATLTDFGLARSLAASRISLTDQLVGTAPYMAPEQTSGQAGPQADVWSLGVVAFEMLCGTLPFGDDEAVAILYRAKHEAPPSACDLNPMLPPAVEAAFASVFEKAPDHRLARAGAFANALRLALAGVGRMPDDVRFGPLPPLTYDPHGSSVPPRGSKPPRTPATPATAATPTSRPGSGPRTPASGPSGSTTRPELTFAQIVGIMFIALAVLLGIALLFKVTVDDPLDEAEVTADAVATSAREANAVLATAAVDARGLDIVAARATADSAGERVAAAQATLAAARRQATETAGAEGKSAESADRPARVAAPTRPPSAQATPGAPPTGGGGGPADPADGPLLTLISPANDEFATGCVFFAWSAPPPDVQTNGRYELRLCSERLAGIGCEPSHTVRTTQRTSDAWQPDKPDELKAGQGIWDGNPQTFRWRVQLSDRPDVASEVGVFGWRKGTAPCRGSEHGSPTSSNQAWRSGCTSGLIHRRGSIYDMTAQETHLEGYAIDKYVIGAFIAAGGFAEVYRAHDTRLSIDIAIKVLKPSQATPENIRRFHVEAEKVARLQNPTPHPNIINISNVGESHGYHWLAMSLLEGETLADRLESGALPLAEATRIVGLVADALDHAHHNHLIHLDIKPSNVFLTRGGSVVLMDFGLVREQHATNGGVTTGIIGTPEYMSPEQINRPRNELTHQSDIYSLGIVAFEAITGHPPFPMIAGNLWSALRPQMQDPLPPVHRPDGSSPPPYVDAALRRATAKETAGRWHSAGDFSIALKTVGPGPKPNGVVAAVLSILFLGVVGVLGLCVSGSPSCPVEALRVSNPTPETPSQPVPGGGQGPTTEIPPIPDPTPTPTDPLPPPVAPATPGPSFAEMQSAIRGVVLSYNDIKVEAMSRLDGSRLADVLTGDELTRRRQSVCYLVNEGRRYDYNDRNRPEIENDDIDLVDADQRATVLTNISEHRVLRRDTGQVITDYGLETYRAFYKLIRLGENTWKIDCLTALEDDEPIACEVTFDGPDPCK